MMKHENLVFVAKSLDGYIAGKNGELDWLHSIPNPEQIDMGYAEFMHRIDALVMGRNTFDTVCGFEGEWPYSKPVFVLSNSMNAIPEKFSDKAVLMKGSLSEVLSAIHEKGFHKLYIDGGATVNSFLAEGLIDEMIITTMPIILGGGIPLFKELPKAINLKHIKSEVFINQVVQNWYQVEK
ncbi:MAG: dihydrofolate reductase family protein [Salibacteraceae bacterium]|jgi:dihydrofolate reductase|nr:dihydrofolate reductase family protein [Salibacteraceae bacterium]MDP4686371.1 dihydrofolate reductase family protein [Salibacteraceae bacterium]MDP4763574.1 dihydrofolate reductase family protein [Salibacteraceae bacterium]MDP4845161.1 dihydrofolate reductase family protein [Salibacteraceae bacterium]